MLRFVVITLAVLNICSCAPQVGYVSMNPTNISRESYCNLDIYTQHQTIPKPTIVIGEINLGDTGFTVDCGMDRMMNLAKSRACDEGADAIKLLEVKPPDIWSTCYRIKAILLKYSDKEPVMTTEKEHVVQQQNTTDYSVEKSDFVERWAVIIGVSQYQDSRIPSLRYASRDANAFNDWIVSPNGGKFAPSRVKVLLNKEATGRKIKDALFVWLKQALEEDVVIIYFAGHGSPESPDSPDNLFLLPYDSDYQNIATTGFPMWDIETALKRFIKAKKVVVVADACHSGGVGQSFDIARRASRGINANKINSGFQNLSSIGDGVCVISASSEKQYSQESKDWGGGHGVFTYYLLKALEGEADYDKDTIVSLGELVPYLSQQVRRATQSAQCPTVAGKFDPALTIGR